MNPTFRALRLIVLVSTLATFSVAQVPPAQTPLEDAWTVLDSGLTNKNVDKRVRAVAVLGGLTENKKAEKSAITALQDDRYEVRGAAAQALGDMGAKSAI